MSRFEAGTNWVLNMVMRTYIIYHYYDLLQNEPQLAGRCPPFVQELDDGPHYTLGGSHGRLCVHRMRNH